MNELIKITEEDGKQVVSARELYKGLESKQEFANWINKKVVNNPFFSENEDWVVFDKSIINSDTQIVKGGRPQINYALTLNTAKKVAMSEQTYKGNEVRDYFIAMEKKAIKLNTPANYISALEELIKSEKQKELIQGKVNNLEQALDVSEQWVSIIRYSQSVNVSETKFNWRVLKAYSLKKGIEIKKVPCPRFTWKNLYHVSVFKKCYPDYSI